MARLEVIGTFWQDKDPETGEEINVLHIFGRTFHSPHTFFYRTLVNFTTWTPWEEMQVTIDGDHLMPLIWNRRLYVFWPSFAKKAVPPPHKDTIDTSSKSIPLQDSRSYWQVSLAWTELRHNKWSAKQVSKNAFDMDPGYFVEDEPSRYAKFAYSFKTSVAGAADGASASLVIRCLFHGPTVTINRLGWFINIVLKETTEVVGAFEVGGCSGESVEAIFGTMPWPNPVTPPGTDVEALTFVQSPGKKGLSLGEIHEPPARQLPRLTARRPSAFSIPTSSPTTCSRRRFFTRIRKHFLRVPAGGKEPGPPGHPRQPRGLPAQGGPRRRTGEGRGGPCGFQGRQGSAPRRRSHPSRHGAPSEVWDILMSLEKKISDIGEHYSQHASSRGSAWGSHALAHNTLPAQRGPGQVRDLLPSLRFRLHEVRLPARDGRALDRSQPTPGFRRPGDFERRYKPTNHVARPLPEETVISRTAPTPSTTRSSSSVSRISSMKSSTRTGVIRQRSAG